MMDQWLCHTEIQHGVGISEVAHLREFLGHLGYRLLLDPIDDLNGHLSTYA